MPSLVHILRLLLEFLRERIRRHPVFSLLATNATSFAFFVVIASRAHGGLRRLLIKTLVRAAKVTPGVRGHVKRMKDNMRGKIEKMVVKDMGPCTTVLPPLAMPEAEVVKQLREWSGAETMWSDGRVSGTVYSGSAQLTRVMSEAFQCYALSNPLHPDVFPSVRKMEAEVVAMVANLFHGSSARDVCGTMTSGGTESILMACKAYRDHAAAARGITEPHMVVPATAHAAFLKAAHYLGIRCTRVPVDSATFRADPAAMARAVTSDTIMLVGSAPCFSQGVIDPIEGLAEVAKGCGAGLHVDCCLGSFLVACMPRLGYAVEPFDFDVDGVTSISCDTHKYGFSAKGSSVVLYADQELRHYQYFVAGDWTGGIYATPTMSGSRPGALVAATWAVMMQLGEPGYLAAFSDILGAVRKLEQGIRAMPALVILGSVDTSVVCFAAAKPSALNIFNVGDAMTSRGWSLNSLQHPACLHICVCLPHAAPGVCERFLEDLRAAVEDVQTAPPGKFKDGMSAIYGMAESIQEDSMVGELACCFIDALYKA